MPNPKTTLKEQSSFFLLDWRIEWFRFVPVQSLQSGSTGGALSPPSLGFVVGDPVGGYGGDPKAGFPWKLLAGQSKRRFWPPGIEFLSNDRFSTRNTRSCWKMPIGGFSTIELPNVGFPACLMSWQRRPCSLRSKIWVPQIRDTFASNESRKVRKMESFTTASCAKSNSSKFGCRKLES